MQERILGKAPRAVSVVGLGAMPLAIAGRPEEADAIRVVHAAIAAGVTWVDVADSYCLGSDDMGYAERLVSRALASAGMASKALLVTTKGGYVRPRGEWELDGRPAHLRAACEASLRALGTDAIFLYQLHGPDPNVYYPDSVGALSDLQREGKIQHIGVCNVDVGHLQDAAKIVTVATVQNRCNPYDRHCFSNGVIDWCERNGAAFVAHSPVGGHQGHPRIARDPVLGAVALRHGASPYQVALAWLLASSPSMLVIPGASRVASAEASVEAAELVLSHEDMSELKGAFPRANLAVRQLVRVRRKVRHLARMLRGRVQ